jgi:hypothetical protein
MGLFGSFSDTKSKFSDLRKYVDDYEIVEEQMSNGKLKKTVRYKGTWTILREVSSGTFFKLWLTVLMAFALIGVYVYTLTLTHTTSGLYTVMVPLMAGLFPCLYLAMGVLALPFRGKPMRRDQYMHSFIRISRSCTAILIFAFLAELITLIYRMIENDWLYLPADWRFTVSGIILIAAAVAIILILRSIEITERENRDS